MVQPWTILNSVSWSLGFKTNFNISTLSERQKLLNTWFTSHHASWMNEFIFFYIKYYYFYHNRRCIIRVFRLHFYNLMFSFTQTFRINLNFFMFFSDLISIGRSSFHSLMVLGRKLASAKEDWNRLPFFIPPVFVNLVFLGNLSLIFENIYPGFLVRFALWSRRRLWYDIICLTLIQPHWSNSLATGVDQSNLVTALAALFWRSCRAEMRSPLQPP